MAFTNHLRVDAFLAARVNSVNAFETRKRHAISIVFLGVIGSEFGPEFESYKLPGHSPDASPAVSDYSVVRHTCHALNYILLQPPSARLPAYSPIRRCAVDLVGRGFAVWQPYLGSCIPCFARITWRNFNDKLNRGVIAVKFVSTRVY